MRLLIALALAVMVCGSPLPLYPTASVYVDPARRQDSSCSAVSAQLRRACESTPLHYAYDYRDESPEALAAVNILCESACADAMALAAESNPQCWASGVTTVPRMRYLPVVCRREVGVACAWKMRGLNQFNCSVYGSIDTCQVAALSGHNGNPRRCAWSGGRCAPAYTQSAMDLRCNPCTKRFAAIAAQVGADAFDGDAWTNAVAKHATTCTKVGTSFCLPFASGVSELVESTACLSDARRQCAFKMFAAAARDAELEGFETFRRCAYTQAGIDGIVSNCLEGANGLHALLIRTHAQRRQRDTFCAQTPAGQYCRSLDAVAAASPCAAAVVNAGQACQFNCSAVLATFLNSTIDCCLGAKATEGTLQLDGAGMSYDRRVIPLATFRNELGGNLTAAVYPSAPASVSVLRAVGKWARLEECFTITSADIIAAAADTSCFAAGATPPPSPGSSGLVRTFKLPDGISVAALRSVHGGKPRFELLFAADLTASTGVDPADVINVTVFDNSTASSRRQGAMGAAGAYVNVTLRRIEAAVIIDGSRDEIAAVAAAHILTNDCNGCAPGANAETLALGLGGGGADVLYGNDGPPTAAPHIPAPAPGANGTAIVTVNGASTGATATTAAPVVLPPVAPRAPRGAAARVCFCDTIFLALVAAAVVAAAHL